MFLNGSVGATESSFADCRDEEVPSIVEAFYRYTTNDDSASASTMLQWWSQNRPSFYHGAASVGGRAQQGALPGLLLTCTPGAACARRFPRRRMSRERAGPEATTRIQL